MIDDDVSAIETTTISREDDEEDGKRNN